MATKNMMEPKMKRVKKQSILFNQREANVIDHYCDRFNVKNRSQFMREAIISEILKKFEEKHPSLWDYKQLKLF